MIDAIRSSVHFATNRPATAPKAASRIDSVSSCVISCRRLAPIDRRTAISAARPAPRTSSRLAMFAQAISSTVPVTASRMISGVRASLSKLLWPRLPGSVVITFALKRAIVCSLMPFWSGASTSLMIA